MSHEGISAESVNPREVPHNTLPAVEGQTEALPAPEEGHTAETAPAPDPVVAEHTSTDALALAAVRERLGLATQEADPTTYSQLPPREALEQVGVANGGNKIVATEGTRYVNINQYPERQEAVARMLKGVLNVSDIVRAPSDGGSPSFYSKEMPIDRLRQETPLEETQADHFILKQVFGDFDHKFSEEKVNNIERQQNRSVYYDFGNANPMHMDNARYSFNLLNEDVGSLSTEETSIVLHKLDALQERFSGTAGEQFIDAIVRASGKEPTELFGLYDFQVADALERTGSKTLDSSAVQKRILNRIDTVRKAIADFVPPPPLSPEGMPLRRPPPPPPPPLPA